MNMLMKIDSIPGDGYKNILADLGNSDLMQIKFMF